MRTDEFDYPLDPARIATVPAEPRDSARLLVGGAGGVEHLRVSDVPSLVGPGDLVVVNDTRVLAARVPFRRATGGAGEVLFLEDLGDGWWEALVRPSRKLSSGVVVDVGDGFAVEIGDDLGQGRRRVRPHADPDRYADVVAALDRWGEMPLPPYLAGTHLDDPDRYQTVYARRPASAAAPTAGLHLTAATLAGIEAAGATIARVELVVGLGTFRPIDAEVVEDHVMHHERYRIPPDTAAAVEAADRVVAIGTTTVRALESAAATGEAEGSTSLFIRRPYRWRVVDVLMTNFHLPRSSLLVMIDAFVGPRWRQLYEVAAADGYRFLSFGDAMWLTRDAAVGA